MRNELKKLSENKEAENNKDIKHLQHYSSIYADMLEHVQAEGIKSAAGGGGA